MEAMTIWKILLALAQTLQTVRTVLRAQGISLDDKPVPDQLFLSVKQLVLVQTLSLDPVGSFVVCPSTCSCGCDTCTDKSQPLRSNLVVLLAVEAAVGSGSPSCVH